MGLYLIRNKDKSVFIDNNTGKFIAFKSPKTNKKSCISIVNKKQLINQYNMELASELWKNVVEMKTPFLETFSHILNCLVVNVTDTCNMRCKYCYACNNNQGKKIKSSTIVNAVLQLSKRIYPEKLTVLFHGGEPLIAYNEIRTAVEQLKNVDNIMYSIQTNGTLLDEEKLGFFKENNFLIGLSLDGITDNNNILRNIDNRIKDYTNNNLKLLINNKEFVKPLFVLHKHNAKDLKKITDYIISNNCDGMRCNFLWNDENCICDNNLLNGMKYIFQKMMETYEDFEFGFKETNIRLLFRRVMYGYIDEYMCMNNPCGAGKETIVINYKGDVYGCNVLIDKNDKNNYMGNINNDSIENIVNKKINISCRSIEKIDKCKKCPFKTLCNGGGCSGFIYNQNKDINDVSAYCKYYYEFILFMIEYMLENEHSNVITNF